MRYDFGDLSEIPVETQPLVADLIAQESYSEAFRLLRSVFSHGDPATPGGCNILGFTTFLRAFTVFIDEVLPAAEEALRLLQRAVELGGDAGAMADFQAFVQDILGEELKKHQQKLEAFQRALGSADPDPALLAFGAVEKFNGGDLHEAARLFTLASKHAARRQSSGESDTDYAFFYRLKAAFCLDDGGAFEEAEPTLREALSYDWASADLWQDRHMTERAYMRLLRHRAALGDREGFQCLWTKAEQTGIEIDFPFPSIKRDEAFALKQSLGL
jgi:tetratricopeptide (TPR) repeat protein